MPTARQTNFNAGELAPGFWGRTDLPKFATGMRRLRNFFCNREGSAVSRPGTTYVNEVKLGVAGGAVRLIPFIYSDSQSYVLEFGAGYIRFHTGGATVLSGLSPYEVVTPYAAVDLALVKYTQSGDILTLTHPLFAPKELKRLGHTSWTLTDVTFRPISAGFRDINTITTTREPFLVTALPTADATHPEREWIWKVTVILQDAVTGATMESLPATVTKQYDGADITTQSAAPTNVTLYSDKPVTLRRPVQSPPPGLPTGYINYRILAYNYYRGRGDLFGFVGQTKTRDFVDVGAEPDYLTQPPRGQNPFEVLDLDGVTLLRTERPIVSVYYQERRLFLGTVQRPETAFASQTGNYYDFDEKKPFFKSGDALLFQLATRKREDIRSALSLAKLLLFTGSSVWTMSGHQGPLDPDSVDARIVEEVGAAQHLQPLLVDGCALFVRSKGHGVRVLIPSAPTVGGDSGTFQGHDISVLSQHLFLASGVLDWCYQEDPFGLVWVVRNDGVMLSLTFSATEGVWAWTRHDTDGSFKWCCSIPETDEDFVYVVVDRTINGVPKRYIERMTSRVKRDAPTDDICLDCALEYDGAPTSTFTGLGALEGKTVYLTGKGLAVYGPLTVTGGSIALGETPDANNGSNLTLYAGLVFTPEAETLDVVSSETRLKQKIVTRVGFEVDDSRGLWVGQDFNHLTEWQQRQVSDGYGPVGSATELVRVEVNGVYDSGARVVLRQTLPLPVTLLGVAREFDVGG